MAAVALPMASERIPERHLPPTPVGASKTPVAENTEREGSPPLSLPLLVSDLGEGTVNGATPSRRFNAAQPMPPSSSQQRKPFNLNFGSRAGQPFAASTSSGSGTRRRRSVPKRQSNGRARARGAQAAEVSPRKARAKLTPASYYTKGGVLVIGDNSVNSGRLLRSVGFILVAQ